MVPPLQPSTTFVRNENYDLANPDNSYGRDDNEQIRLAERVIAKLEGGAESLLFASGMAAISALVSSLRRGDTLLLQKGIYWGTTAYVRRFAEHREVRLVEEDPLDLDAFRHCILEHKPDLVFVEVPSNPWIRVCDVPAIAECTRKSGSVLAVDATAATPVLFRPLQHGADVVIHSCTKALNGHSDVMAGVLTSSDPSSYYWRFALEERAGAGAILSAHAAWLLLRGLRTLDVRVERMTTNAARIADFLEAHEKIADVWYPALVSHPDHAVAESLMGGGYGYLMSFLIAGDRSAALKFCRHLGGILRATSLGGTESLVEHRHTIEGELTGCPENLIRLSVGIEDVGDLIAEIDAALSHL